MFNLVNSLGGKRDEYGVGDLLAEVSKRSSSISDENRKEIGDIAKRLRDHKPSSPARTPRETPDNSQHEVKKDFGRDLLKVDLLRGFGPAPSPTSSTVDSPRTLHSSNLSSSQDNGGILLRGFGTSHCDDEEGDDSSGFEENRKL